MSRTKVALLLAALAPAVCFAPTVAADSTDRQMSPIPTGEAPRSHGGGGVVATGAGETRFGHGDAWHPIVRGAALPMHAELRTERDPLRVQLAGGAVVELSPDGSAALAGEVELLLEHRTG